MDARYKGNFPFDEKVYLSAHIINFKVGYDILMDNGVEIRSIKRDKEAVKDDVSEISKIGLLVKRIEAKDVLINVVSIILSLDGH